jgi:hypothetical protein
MNRVENVPEIEHGCRRCSGIGRLKRNDWEIAVFFTKEVPPNNNRGASSAELVRNRVCSTELVRIAAIFNSDRSKRRQLR